MLFFDRRRKLEDQAARDEEASRTASIIAAIDRSMASIEFSPSGEVVTVNDNFLHAMGYSRDEVVGQHHKMFCEPEFVDSREYSDLWRKLNAGEFVEGRFKRLKKSGDEIWIHATYTPVLDAEGKVIKVVKFATNVTDTVLFENEMRGKLDALNRSMAIIEFSPDGIIVDCNDNFLAAVGYSKQQIIGQHHRIFCEPDYADSPDYAKFWDDLNKGQFFTGRFKRVDKSGHLLWLEASYNPVYNSDGTLYRIIKFATNITEQVQRVAAERESAEFAYRISKETRETAETGGDVISQAVKEMNMIADSVQGASAQIQDLNKQSAEISSIINTIQAIADQTNLLALNAAIEAARAGDQGRGFAVVADEVRQLAARTSESTSEISTMIANVQQYTSSASTSMDLCLQQASRGVELANKTGEVIGKIQSGAVDVVSAIDRFSNALKKA